MDEPKFDLIEWMGWIAQMPWIARIALIDVHFFSTPGMGEKNQGGTPRSRLLSR